MKIFSRADNRAHNAAGTSWRSLRKKVYVFAVILCIGHTFQQIGILSTRPETSTVPADLENAHISTRPKVDISPVVGQNKTSTVPADLEHVLNSTRSKTQKPTKNSAFVWQNDPFIVPTDLEYVQKWRGYRSRGISAKYVRNVTEIEKRGKEGKCKSTLEVLEWVMNDLNKHNLTLMIAYGELIHMHREKDFVRKDGKFIDDDFDMLASPDTIAHSREMEPELFRRFGWTLRAFVNADGYVVFIQVMATCGHKPDRRPAKIISGLPGIEMYPVVPMVQGQDNKQVVKEMWSAHLFTESMILPHQHVVFNSTAFSRPLHLQIPNNPFDLLECVYGNWSIPSSKHGGFGLRCTSEK